MSSSTHCSLDSVADALATFDRHDEGWCTAMLAKIGLAILKFLSGSGSWRLLYLVCNRSAPQKAIS